jgi:hypothetical protein
MADEINRDPKQIDSTYDPEHEIPDPEQVERNRQRAENEYREQNEKKNPAA